MTKYIALTYRQAGALRGISGQISFIPQRLTGIFTPQNTPSVVRRFSNPSPAKLQGPSRMAQHPEFLGKTRFAQKVIPA